MPAPRTAVRGHDQSFDVIIVGARCAGAALATHLARAGLDVVLVDSAPLPAGQVASTHADAMVLGSVDVPTVSFGSSASVGVATATKAANAANFLSVMKCPLQNGQGKRTGRSATPSIQPTSRSMVRREQARWSARGGAA